MSATYENLKSYRVESGDEGESTSDSQVARFKEEKTGYPEGGAPVAHGAAFEGGPEGVRETLSAPGHEGSSRWSNWTRLDGEAATEERDGAVWLVGFSATWPNRPTNRGCLAWWAAAVQAAGYYNHDERRAAGAAVLERLGFAPVVLVDREPVCDVCGLDALSLKLIARNDRPRRRTLEVDGCRVAAYVCRVCEGKVESSPSERGWSERMELRSVGNPFAVDGFIRGDLSDLPEPVSTLGGEFGSALEEALDGAEHGDHVREACCFDGWPGASAVWLGYALGRFLLWLQGAELRPLRDLAREAWDPHDEGAAPYFFDAGVRHG